MKKQVFLLKSSGAVNLLMMIFISIVAILVVATIQSRLLLQIRRLHSLSDILIADYDAESQIYDMVAGLYYPNFTFPNGKTTLPLLSDGTKITVIYNDYGTTKLINITAERPFAVTKFEAIRQLTYVSSGPEEIEVALSLDCTSSMTSLACPTCTTTRMEELKKALDIFLDDISKYSNAHLGVSVFALNSNWMLMKDATGAEVFITPDKKIPAAQIKQAVDSLDYGFGKYSEKNNIHGSPACQKANLLPHTSIGSGLSFLHDFYQITPPEPNTKRIEIVITDGKPNSRIPHPQCYPEEAYLPHSENDLCCPEGSKCSQTKSISGGVAWSCFDTSGCDKGGDCENEIAEDFLRCTAASTDVLWSSEYAQEKFGLDQKYFGARDPNIDLYAITVFELNSTSDVYQLLNSYSTKYYPLANAAQLSSALSDIITKISEISSILTIRKSL